MGWWRSWYGEGRGVRNGERVPVRPPLHGRGRATLDDEAAGCHEIERVDWVALAHENFAAGDLDRYEALLEVGKLGGRQIAEGLDQRKRGGPSGAFNLRRLSVLHGALASDRVVSRGG